MVKFEKNDRLNALIFLARDEQFLLVSLKMIQRRDHWIIFFIVFGWMKPTILLAFHFFLTNSPLNMIIPPHNIEVFAYQETSSITPALSTFISHPECCYIFWIWQTLAEKVAL